MKYRSYPRLSTHEATTLMLELLDVDPVHRYEHASAWQGRATSSPTATIVADAAHLETVRTRVLAHARVHGFGVAEVPLKGFDTGMPGVLDGALEMMPAEAGRADVWNYLTLVLLPDVAMWRWPNHERKPGYERLLGKPRNCFRRHWRRGVLFGVGLASQLSEDEMVQITERPGSMGADTRVGRAVAEVFIRVVTRWHLIDRDGNRAQWNRMNLMRELAKGVNRYGMVVALSALSDREMRRQIAVLAEQAVDRALAAADRELHVVKGRSLEGLEDDVVPLFVSEQDVSVEHEFNQAMSRLIQRAEAEPAADSRFLRTVVTDFGGVEAAARLAATGEWDRQVAALGDALRVRPMLLDPRFRSLFDEALLEGLEAEAASVPDNGPEGLEITVLLAERVSERIAELESFSELDVYVQTVRTELALHGVVAVCRRLLESAFLSSMFLVLARIGKPESSLEVLLLEEQFTSLWDEDARAALSARVGVYHS